MPFNLSFNPLAKPEPPKVAVGDIVSLPPSTRYGVVVSSQPFHHPWRGMQPLYNVHYIDSKTGGKMECPDRRCEGKLSTCPIHSGNVWEEGMTKWTKSDLVFYVKTGLINEELFEVAYTQAAGSQASPA